MVIRKSGSVFELNETNASVNKSKRFLEFKMEFIKVGVFLLVGSFGYQIFDFRMWKGYFIIIGVAISKHLSHKMFRFEQKNS